MQLGRVEIFNSNLHPLVVSRPHRHAEAAVAASLLAFIVVYFTVFGAGTAYILRLMGHAPSASESGLEDNPIRTAGITPAPAVSQGEDR